MIFDNIIKAAFGFINTVAPSLSPQNFLDAMRDDFDPELTDEENKKRMMEKIRGGKLGKGLAEAASYEPQTGKGFAELLTEVQTQYTAAAGGAGAGAGAGVVGEEGIDEEEEQVNQQKSQS